MSVDPVALRKRRSRASTSLRSTSFWRLASPLAPLFSAIRFFTAWICARIPSTSLSAPPPTATSGAASVFVSAFFFFFCFSSLPSTTLALCDWLRTSSIAICSSTSKSA